MEKGSELFDEVKELRRKRKEGMMKSLPSTKKSRRGELDWSVVTRRRR
jgi:hypothetical protein